MVKKDLWKKRLPELVKKGLITDEQRETLREMIESPDNENMFVVQQLVRNFIRERLSDGLNEGQKEAFAKIIGFLEDPTHDALVLKGYAGTGKTFLVKRVLEYITQTEMHSRTGITAPTNKAVKVLYEQSALNDKNLNPYIFEDLFDATSRLTYSTIHKLLAMREVITDKGEQYFQADPRNPSDINNFKYLIVDESSMLDDRLCDDLMQHSAKARIIFMGDPCQIPPVKQKNSIPFREQKKYNFLVVELTEIMRQKTDNPIIAASFEIRENIQEANPIPVLQTQLNEKGHGIIYLNKALQEDKDKIRPLLKTYFDSDEFVRDADYMKVIAWRNKTVGYMNNVIRELLFGEGVAPYVVGERLIVQKPIFRKKDKYWKIVFTTSEELEVTAVREESFRYFEGTVNLAGMCYELDVTGYDVLRGRSTNDTIRVIHESTREAYDNLLKSIKEKAIKHQSRLDWLTYFNVKKWFANVGYNYAITAHKSQGSTYRNVLFLEDDINYNDNVLERNRIKYTSYSRASELLYVLRKQ